MTKTNMKCGKTTELAKGIHSVGAKYVGKNIHKLHLDARLFPTETGKIYQKLSYHLQKPETMWRPYYASKHGSYQCFILALFSLNLILLLLSQKRGLTDGCTPLTVFVGGPFHSKKSYHSCTETQQIQCYW